MTLVVGRRGKIKRFSRKAYFRFLTFINSITPPGPPRFLTLTFTYWRPPAETKRLLNRYLTQLRGQYIWRLDISKRGRIHYHLLYWGPEPDAHLKADWFKLVGPSPYAFDARPAGKGASRYFMAKKVFQRQEDFEMEGAGRFWGHSKGIKPDAKEKISVTKAEAAWICRLLAKWGRISAPLPRPGFVPALGIAPEVWIFGSEDEVDALYTRIDELLRRLRAGDHIPDELLRDPITGREGVPPLKVAADPAPAATI